MFKFLKKTKVAKYWHIEIFIMVPWAAYVTYLLYEAVELLKIIAH